MADIAASAPASADSSSGSSSAQSTGTTVPSGEATPGQSTQVGNEQPQVGTPQSGEPPRERWNDILDNTRKKTRAEVEAEYQSRYGKYDPLTAVMDWLEKAEQHRLYGPLIKQHYQTRTQTAKPAEIPPEPQPDVPIVDENGHITGKTYSADRLREWNRWNGVQQKAELDARFGPIEERERQRQQAAEEQQLRSQAEDNAKQILTELRQQPHYKENEPAIADILQAHPEWGANVHRAYMHFMHTVVLPKLSVAEAQSTIDSITKQGEATTVAPGTTAVGQPRFKSFASAAKYFAEHPDEAATMAGRR